MDKIKFRDLSIGDRFDFINDNKIGYNSFFIPCKKISNRKYIDDTRIRHTVGSINCIVYHVNNV